MGVNGPEPYSQKRLCSSCMKNWYDPECRASKMSSFLLNDLIRGSQGSPRLTSVKPVPNIYWSIQFLKRLKIAYCQSSTTQYFSLSKASNPKKVYCNLVSDTNSFGSRISSCSTGHLKQNSLMAAESEQWHKHYIWLLTEVIYQKDDQILQGQMALTYHSQALLTINQGKG